MPWNLDETDISLLESLMNNGRKSFREISREIKVSAPTVKSRYERLVNLGVIKGVSVILDPTILEANTDKNLDRMYNHTIENQRISLNKKMAVTISCDYCNGQVPTKPRVLKFAGHERFFCCNPCKSLYAKKYKGRIKALGSDRK